MLFAKRCRTVTCTPNNGKIFEGFLPPSSDPLNFQHSRRAGKDIKSSGNRQKPGHPTGLSKPILEIINFTWLSARSSLEFENFLPGAVWKPWPKASRVEWNPEIPGKVLAAECTLSKWGLLVAEAEVWRACLGVCKARAIHAVTARHWWVYGSGTPPPTEVIVCSWGRACDLFPSPSGAAGSAVLVQCPPAALGAAGSNVRLDLLRKVQNPTYKSNSAGFAVSLLTKSITL